MQSCVNEDMTANKGARDIHMFKGNSYRSNRNQKMITLNNFSILRQKFRQNEQSMRLDLVLVSGNNLILTLKTLTAESAQFENEHDNISNSSTPNNISMPSQITNEI